MDPNAGLMPFAVAALVAMSAEPPEPAPAPLPNRTIGPPQVQTAIPLPTPYFWEATRDGETWLPRTADQFESSWGLMVYYTDGSISQRHRQRGFAASAAVWYENGQWHGRGRSRIDSRDCNPVEMSGIVLALLTALDTRRAWHRGLYVAPYVDRVLIWTDNLWCVKRLGYIFPRITHGLLGISDDGPRRRGAPLDPIEGEQAVIQLYSILRRLGVTVQVCYVRGHSNCEGNDRADHVAKQSMRMTRTFNPPVGTIFQFVDEWNQLNFYHARSRRVRSFF